jgi:RNA polymerase sigma factor (sigma-70 family)
VNDRALGNFLDEIAAAGNYQKVTTLSELGVAIMNSSTVPAGVRRLRGLLAAQCRQEESDERLLQAFLASRDESAFAVLVRRHGPMVLHVCRRVLGHQQDAEDAFQATFLVLARNAVALRKKTALASWLHGTAYRTALKAKQSAARRRKHEGRAPGRSAVDPSGELLWREVRTLLDEEIARLPDAYRSVFVLCCLESMSQAEAAQRLGLKEGTVSSRLAEARKRLQLRLSRRGVELTALLAATALMTPPASALPAVLLTTTTREAVSPAIAALADSGSSLLSFGKAKLTAALVLAVSILSGAGLWVYRDEAVLAATAPPTPAKESAERPQPRKHTEEHGPSVEVSGRVVDPDGKPVRGAKLVFTYGFYTKVPHKVWAVSTAEGRFAFTLPVKELDNRFSEEKWWEDTYVVAAAEGYGFAAARLDKPGAADLTLRLVKDDVPIRGRVLDLQGQPVAGARVRINNNTLVIAKKGDLTGFLADLKASNGHRWEHLAWLYSPAFDLLFPPVMTGADGRFVMKGIGRERIALLRIEGPTIATQEVQVMTRANEKIQLPKNRESPKGPIDTYYGADFELLAALSRPIVGVVRDKDTGKPLAGVTVESEKIAHDFKNGFLRTTTDMDGRYQIDGFPKGGGNEIVARTNDYLPPSGNEMSSQRPYLSAVKKVGNPLGLGPVTVDFALKRGIWVQGRVTDKKTGKPLSASVKYFCFNDNPNAKELASTGNFDNWRQSREDGFFQMPVLPGRGLIAVRAYQDHYVMGVGAEKIKGPRDKGVNDLFITTPHFCFARNFHAVVEIDPKAGEESIRCDMILEPGRSLKGTVLGPDGKPLAGARISGLKDMGYWEENATADFTVESLLPNKPRVLQFVHDGEKLVGMVVLQGDEKAPLSVRLEPSGALAGRLVTLQGDPLAGARVTCGAILKDKGQTVHPTALDVRTGKDGRFRIEGLKPGLKYGLNVTTGSYVREIVGGEPKDLTIQAGQTKDLGDVTVKLIE